MVLALRPESSAQARLPPTAPLVPRGGRRGLLVLSAGPLAYPYGATHRQVVASSLDSARVPFRGTNRGLEGFGKPDTGRG